MSDELFILGKGAEFREGLDTELIEDIRANFAGIYPHNLIVRIRVLIADAGDGISIEPLQLHKKTRGDVLSHIAEWVAQRAERVIVRLVGYRGRSPLPDVEKRNGTIDDVLGFRQRGTKPYFVEFELH
jgi:hypothetical protein